jgi:hypothetical protein
MEKFRKALHWLARPKLLLYLLPWLMILLVWGTVAQKDLGIYAAHKAYFSSWIIWTWGFLPLPGAYPTLGLMTLSLLAKFLLYSPWRKEQAGIILSHLGVLILMIGGLLTAMTQKEGFLMLPEGGTSNLVSDYHDRAVYIEKNGEDFHVLPFASVTPGQKIDIDGAEISITEKCDNCRPVMMTEEEETRRGFAQKVKLLAAAAEKEREADLSGITFSVQGADRQDNGTWIAVEEIPKKAEFSKNGNDYAISVGRARTELPFGIELEDFEREMHPGMNMAKAFTSRIIVHDGGVSWPYMIRMNEPLRYKGYTFYQSSFSIRPDGEFSILSVVQNKGRIFPYIASAVIFAGLLLHFLLRLRKEKSV